MTHIYISKVAINGSHWLWLVAWTAQTHYLHQCWNIVNWPLRTNFSEFLIEIDIFSFDIMRLKISVWEMAAIFSRPRSVKDAISTVNRMSYNGKCIWKHVYSSRCSEGKKILSYLILTSTWVKGWKQQILIAPNSRYPDGNRIIIMCHGIS